MTLVLNNLIVKYSNYIIFLMKGQQNQIAQYTEKIKLITIGDQGSGKTSVLLKYTDNNFNLAQGCTVGVDFKLKDQKYKQISYKIQIFDTAGQDKFQSLLKKYYQGSDAALVIFSLQNWYQYYIARQGQLPLNRIDYWVHQFQDNNKNTDAKIVFVGNKLDLLVNNQSKDLFIQTVTQAFEPYIKEHSTKLLFTSAMTGQNIQQSFLYILQKIYERKKPPVRPKSIVLHDQYNYNAAENKIEEKQGPKVQDKNQNINLQKNGNSEKTKKKSCC